MFKSISFCFPAYNEEKNIKQSVTKAIEVCQRHFPDYEIIVTNDGSQDQTAAIVRELIRANPKIKLIDQENQGYGGAVWNAISQASKELVFFTDADLQFDLEELAKLLPFIDQYDVVIGYRSPRADPFIRKLNAWLWTQAVNLLLGLRIRDMDCAFKLFRQPLIRDLTIKYRGATFSPELLWRLKAKGATIKQLPVKHLPRQSGSQTGANLKVILRAFKELRPLIQEKNAVRRIKKHQ